MHIFNLTQHVATLEQVAAGVVEPDAETKVKIQQLLTFNTIPNDQDLNDVSLQLAALVPEECEYAMIGGAPYLMSWLENALGMVRVQPLYSFTKRETEELHNINGTVTKTSHFKHIGWVKA